MCIFVRVSFFLSFSSNKTHFEGESRAGQGFEADRTFPCGQGSLVRISCVFYTRQREKKGEKRERERKSTNPPMFFFSHFRSFPFHPFYLLLSRYLFVYSRASVCGLFRGSFIDPRTQHMDRNVRMLTSTFTIN